RFLRGAAEPKCLPCIKLWLKLMPFFPAPFSSLMSPFLPGVETPAVVQPAIERDRALLEVAASADHAPSVVRYPSRLEAVDPRQPELLPNDVPAYPDLDRQVLPAPRTPDSIIRSM